MQSVVLNHTQVRYLREDLIIWMFDITVTYTTLGY